MTVVHIDKTSRRKKDRNKFSVYTRRDTIIEEKKSIMSKISSMKLNSYIWLGPVSSKNHTSPSPSRFDML